MMRGLQRSIITLSCSIDWLDPLGVQIIYPCCWYDTQWKQSIWLFQLQVIHLRNIKVLKCLGKNTIQWIVCTVTIFLIMIPINNSLLLIKALPITFNIDRFFITFELHIYQLMSGLYSLLLEYIHSHLNSGCYLLIFTYIFYTFEPVHYVPHPEI